MVEDAGAVYVGKRVSKVMNISVVVADDNTRKDGGEKVQLRCRRMPKMRALMRKVEQS